MKNFIFCAYTIISLCFLGACKKYECPTPRSTVNNNDSTSTKTYTTTITGSDFMDCALSSLTPDIPSGGIYPVSYATAWTVNGSPMTGRSFFKFNYSSIPAGATIQKATITLNADTTTSYHGHNPLSGPNDWYFRRAASAWDISTIDWANQPNSDTTAQIHLPASTSFNETYTIDITSFVQEDIANPSAAYGFMIRLVNEAMYREVIFASSENSNTSIRPKLDVVYTK